MSKKKVKQIELSPVEAQALKERVKARTLQESDWQIVEALLECYGWMCRAFQEAKLSVGRIKSLLGFKSEKKSKILKQDPADSQGVSDSSKETQQSSQQTQEQSQSQPKKPKGHGRKGHSAYTGAQSVYVAHESLKAGDPCPLGCKGKLYEIKPEVIVRITGSAMARATRYIKQKLRCGKCGKIFCACLPQEVEQKDKYDEKIKAVLSLQKYYLGTPFHRIEQFQELLGVPLPDAVQYELIEKVADCHYPIFKQLVHQGAQAQVGYNDDTKVRILSLIKQNQIDPKRKRKGMQTTGIVCQMGKRQIALFFSGRKHAGENLDDLLTYRDKQLQKMIQMSDALSASKTKKQETIPCNCLAHARRKFTDIYNCYPQKCQYVIEQIAKVYKTDEQAKEKQLTAQQRLYFHRRHSKPVMQHLRRWLDKQLKQDLVEKNSSLGKAIQHMINHWQKLTRFLHIEGAPLDSNLVERALKVPIRNRKNSYFFKTEHSALIGDILTSVIYTCALAKINPLDYLVAIQENRSLVHRNPKDWLPWTYSQTLKSVLSDSDKVAIRAP